ncbi:hypothetical protein [Spiroplasma endosymbiont of Virgichneumon dumeticola]|uniref:hypothetical protein n=1 Tax=Spiroplasma endosymbiont of Virgichneumon dumeticola TaxID=3139323 RepID=UPI0035C8FF30
MPNSNQNESNNFNIKLLVYSGVIGAAVGGMSGYLLADNIPNQIIGNTNLDKTFFSAIGGWFFGSLVGSCLNLCNLLIYKFCHNEVNNQNNNRFANQRIIIIDNDSGHGSDFDIEAVNQFNDEVHENVGLIRNVV